MITTHPSLSASLLRYLYYHRDPWHQRVLISKDWALFVLIWDHTAVHSRKLLLHLETGFSYLAKEFLPCTMMFSSVLILLSSPEKYSTRRSLRENAWTSFFLSHTFLLGVGVNVKPLSKTFICEYVRIVLERLRWYIGKKIVSS